MVRIDKTRLAAASLDPIGLMRGRLFAFLDPVRRFRIVVVATLWGVATACSGPVADAVPYERPAAPVAPARQRDAAFARAKLWVPVPVEAMDVRHGPARKDGFPFLAAVTCDWVDKPLRGHSLKFACDIGHNDVVKVKIGQANGEVFGEVAATRLLWALGFGADTMYPVRLTCHGCPARLGGTVLPSGARHFDPAVIERPMPGSEFDDDPGWSWGDLPRVDSSAGGATRPQRDALTLLAVFLQHSDNKIEQQRLVCLGERTSAHAAVCARPFLLIDDVGLTFGAANFINDNALGGANLDAWAHTPVWQGPNGCVGNLAPSFTGTLSHPAISEEGRQFLASLLMRLSKTQIRELFAVSRMALHDQAVQHAPAATPLNAWVTAFIQKRHDIVSRRCA